DVHLRHVGRLGGEYAPLAAFRLLPLRAQADLVDVVERAEGDENDGQNRGRLPAHGWLLRRAAAKDGGDTAGEGDAGQDEQRQEADSALLVLVHEYRRLLHVLGADRDLVFLFGQPAHGVEEEVAVALDVQELVRGDVRRAVHDDARLLHRRDRGD